MDERWLQVLCVSNTPPPKSWFVSEPSSGPKSLGSPQHAISPQSGGKHVFGGAGGTVSTLVNEDSGLLKECQERSEGSGEQQAVCHS